MPGDMIRYLATEQEVALLEDFDDIGYGELYLVAYEEKPRTKSVEVTQRTANFFGALRRIGKADKVVIHDGEPTMIEYRSRSPSGYRCLRKMKM